MSDQDQRVERNEERVEDLEVRTDDAREVAGGATKKGKAAGRRKGKAAGYDLKKNIGA